MCAGDARIGASKKLWSAANTVLLLSCLSNLASSGWAQSAFDTYVSTQVSRLNDKHPSSRQAAVRALRSILLEARAKYKNTSTEIDICDAVAKGGVAAVPILLKFLNDADGRVRYAAAKSLAGIQDGADRSVPALINRL